MLTWTCRMLHFLHIDTTSVSAGVWVGCREDTPAMAEIGNDHCTRLYRMFSLDVAPFLWCTSIGESSSALRPIKVLGFPRLYLRSMFRLTTPGAFGKVNSTRRNESEA